MNTGRSKYIFPLLLALGLATGSCHKNKEATTAAGKLQGRWKMTKFASDNGSNPLVYSPLPSAEDFEWTFNGNSGFDIESWNNVEGLKETFTYQIIGDTLRKITSHETVDFIIIEINASDMIWTRTYRLADSNMATEGYFFNRH